MVSWKQHKYNQSNWIHPTAIIEDGVSIGKDNYIGPYCIIKKGTTIGNNNRFESHVVIGSNAEHRDYFKSGSNYSVVIGDNNIFREYITINAGTFRNTQVFDNIVMLRGSHLGHDCIVEDSVTLSCNVLIGGETHIMIGVNMGLGAICHQYSVLGSYSMIGMNSTVTKQSQIKPGEIHIGNPCRFLKLNKIGLERAHIDGEQLLIEEDRYFNLCKKEI
jgi:UDP-N-acetylglucosamine acyltransferase